MTRMSQKTIITQSLKEMSWTSVYFAGWVGMLVTFKADLSWDLLFTLNPTKDVKYLRNLTWKHRYADAS